MLTAKLVCFSSAPRSHAKSRLAIQLRGIVFQSRHMVSSYLGGKRENMKNAALCNDSCLCTQTVAAAYTFVHI